MRTEAHLYYHRSAQVLIRRTSTGLLLAAANGEYAVVELGGSGGILWDLLAEPVILHDLVEALAGIFDTAPEAIWQSVESTLSELVTMSAVTVTDVR